MSEFITLDYTRAGRKVFVAFAESRLVRTFPIGLAEKGPNASGSTAGINPSVRIRDKCVDPWDYLVHQPQGRVWRTSVLFIRRGDLGGRQGVQQDIGLLGGWHLDLTLRD